MTDMTPPGRPSLAHTDSSLSPIPSPHHGPASPFGAPHLLNQQAQQHTQNQPAQHYSPHPTYEAANGSRFPPGQSIPTKAGGVADLPTPHPAISSDTAHPQLKSTTTVPRKRKADSTNVASNKDATPKEKKPRKPREPRQLGPDGKPIPRQKKDKTTSAQKSAATPKTSSPSTMQPPDTFKNGVDNIKKEIAPPPRPTTSGQRYDPIRGVMSEQLASASTPPRKPSPHVPPVSRSPTVADLLNPGNDPRSREPRTRSPPRETPPTIVPITSSTTAPADTAPPVPIPASTFRAVPDNMEDKSVKADAKTSSSGPTPKVKRPTPPLSKLQATGSGLLSSSDLFGGSNQSADKPLEGVTIDFRIELDSEGGNTINFAQEIIKRYGREALNPRAVAHRERLLQVAAAANKLDQGSGDDMDLDLSDPEGDSNADGNASRDDKSNAENAKPKKRNRKVEDYDKEDDFIDDTEMAWEQQAAVAKDGFFVYSGPLIPAAEYKPDSAAPAKKPRARGKPKDAKPDVPIYNRDGSLRKKPGPRPRAETGAPPIKRPRKKKDGETGAEVTIAPTPTPQAVGAA